MKKFCFNKVKKTQPCWKQDWVGCNSIGSTLQLGAVIDNQAFYCAFIIHKMEVNFKMNNISKEDLKLFEEFMAYRMQREQAAIKKEPAKRKFHRRSRNSGSVYSLGGNRKKPFVAAITIGKDTNTGKPIKKTLGTYKTREEAETELSLYNLHIKGLAPDVVSSANIKQDVPTIKEIWDIIYNNDLTHLSKNTLKSYKLGFNYSKVLHDRKINTIKLNDIQPIFDRIMIENSSVAKMNIIKVVLNYIFEYACKYDYIQKNYISYVSFRDTMKAKKTKKPFDKEIIKVLFEIDEDVIAQTILIMIYTGMRPSELLELKKENIHLDQNYLIGGGKTKAGTNRTIPIHPCIKEYVQNFTKSKIIGMRYNNYRIKFNNLKEKLNFDNTPHSARHTFATLANEYKLDEYLIKVIIGHTTNDITKDIYTHVDNQRLVNEINKLPILK